MKEREQSCPSRDKHTPCPEGYNQWHAWAARMSKTHAQVRCQDCSLWAIWLPKAEAKIINAKDRADEREIIQAVKRAYPTSEQRYRKDMRRLKRLAT